MSVTVVYEPDDVAAAIREYCREHPEIRKDEYQVDNPRSLDGHCYVASEAYYHATGRTLDVICLSWERPGTHWYLFDGDQYIDLTGDPHEGVPYAEGVPKGFLTGDAPSKRAQRVLDGIALKAPNSFARQV